MKSRDAERMADFPEAALVDSLEQSWKASASGIYSNCCVIWPLTDRPRSLARWRIRIATNVLYTAHRLNSLTVERTLE